MNDIAFVNDGLFRSIQVVCVHVRCSLLVCLRMPTLERMLNHSELFESISRNFAHPRNENEIISSNRWNTLLISHTTFNLHTRAHTKHLAVGTQNNEIRMKYNIKR